MPDPGDFGAHPSATRRAALPVRRSPPCLRVRCRRHVEVRRFTLRRHLRHHHDGRGIPYESEPFAFVALPMIVFVGNALVRSAQESVSEPIYLDGEAACVLDACRPRRKSAISETAGDLDPSRSGAIRYFVHLAAEAGTVGLLSQPKRNLVCDGLSDFASGSNPSLRMRVSISWPSAKIRTHEASARGASLLGCAFVNQRRGAATVRI